MNWLKVNHLVLSNKLSIIKENCIPRKFLPNYNGKETPEEKEIMRNLTKEKVRAELQLQKIRQRRSYK